MKKIYLSLIAILILSVFVFCKCKKEPEPEPEPEPTPFSFTSLTTEDDTLSFPETTKLTALATGEELSYVWIPEKGDIIGDGNTVNYAPSACTMGNTTISCKVSNENNSETKEIIIYVQ
jgi:hypothetical protein